MLDIAEFVKFKEFRIAKWIYHNEFLMKESVGDQYVKTWYLLQKYSNDFNLSNFKFDEDRIGNQISFYSKV